MLNDVVPEGVHDGDMAFLGNDRVRVYLTTNIVDVDIATLLPPTAGILVRLGAPDLSCLIRHVVVYHFSEMQ